MLYLIFKHFRNETTIYWRHLDTWHVRDNVDDKIAMFYGVQKSTSLLLDPYAANSSSSNIPRVFLGV